MPSGQRRKSGRGGSAPAIQERLRFGNAYAEVAMPAEDAVISGAVCQSSAENDASADSLAESEEFEPAVRLPLTTTRAAHSERAPVG